MQPVLWQPPVQLSKQEEHIIKRIRKAKLFVFLREHRHELLDEAFQRELACLYRKTERAAAGSSSDADSGAHPGGVHGCF
jgi:hypothetical protein